MRYHSTRNRHLDKSFQEVVSEGLSLEGGLFVPESIPDLSAELPQWKNWTYPQMAERIYSCFASESLNDEERKTILKETLSRFRSEKITPLVQKGNTFILELFHGPTLSFKDVALQTLGGLFQHWPLSSGQRTVVGATSGDTGSAAIAGVQGKKGVRAFILFPEGRVSPVQELQMTTVPDENVQCIAIDGSFDDCQNIVKELFANKSFREEIGLSAVNSINWARITSQIVYYFSGYFQWLEQRGLEFGAPLAVSVPTGNFGDILAGYVAQQMGLPLSKLIIASNENDILTRFYNSGSYEMKTVVPTISPAMDIQISSNFERLLYLLHDRDDITLAEKMKELKTKGVFTVSDEVMAKLKKTFCASRVSNEDCSKTITQFFATHQYTLDPHTAVGVKAAQDNTKEDEDVMCLSTAHPGKFQDAVEDALKTSFELPPELECLKGLPTRKSKLPASTEEVKQFILNFGK
jgi:threonine synthase